MSLSDEHATKGRLVRLRQPVWSYVRNREVPSGTPGRILAAQYAGGETRALVKLRGFAWPIDVPTTVLEEAI